MKSAAQLANIQGLSTAIRFMRKVSKKKRDSTEEH